MAKTPTCNSFLWKVDVIRYTVYCRVQGITMYCKVLGFTGVYWREGWQPRQFVIPISAGYCWLLSGTEGHFGELWGAVGYCTPGFCWVLLGTGSFYSPRPHRFYRFFTFLICLRSKIKNVTKSLIIAVFGVCLMSNLKCSILVF